MTRRRTGRWMAAAACLMVVAAACGSDSPGSGSTTTEPLPPATLADVALGPFYEVGGTEQQAAAVLVAGCASLSPLDRSTDSYSFNGVITGLLAGTGPTWAGDGVRRDQKAVDEAIVGACASHASEPTGFLDQVGAALDLSAADLQSAVDDACTRFRNWQRFNADDPSAPPSFDIVPAAVVALLGDDLAPARMVDAYCGTSSTTPPSSTTTADSGATTPPTPPGAVPTVTLPAP